MISRMQIVFKKYNADGIGSPSTTLPRVASYRRQPWTIKSTTPMVLVHVHRFHQPTNKTTHTHIGGGNASRTPAPLTFCNCSIYFFGVTVALP